jgi:putative FmdB family regulatory protein
MPLFEFVCQACQTPFEELVRSSEAVKNVTCPSCGSRQVRRQLSTIAATRPAASGYSLSSASAAACSPGGT